eukprot:scaffold28362_cov65-Phaeocystis_antarctica.AAC.9
MSRAALRTLCQRRGPEHEPARLRRPLVRRALAPHDADTLCGRRPRGAGRDGGGAEGPRAEQGAGVPLGGRHARPPADEQGPGAAHHLDGLPAQPPRQLQDARDRAPPHPHDEEAVQEGAAGGALHVQLRVDLALARAHRRPRALEPQGGRYVPHVGAAVALHRACGGDGPPRAAYGHRRLLRRGPLPHPLGPALRPVRHGRPAGLRWTSRRPPRMQAIQPGRPWRLVWHAHRHAPAPTSHRSTC